jgi:hypothetical protein
MSFLRHDEIYRSDVGGAVRRGCASASPVAGRVVEVPRGCPENENGERSADRVPRSSSTMSLESAIPWRVALQQSPPPLHRPISMLHQSAETVNRPPMRGGEFSTGDLGNFQPALTRLLVISKTITIPGLSGCRNPQVQRGSQPNR